MVFAGYVFFQDTAAKSHNQYLTRFYIWLHIYILYIWLLTFLEFVVAPTKIILNYRIKQKQQTTLKSTLLKTNIQKLKRVMSPIIGKSPPFLPGGRGPKPFSGSYTRHVWVIGGCNVTPRADQVTLPLYANFCDLKPASVAAPTSGASSTLDFEGRAFD